MNYLRLWRGKCCVGSVAVISDYPDVLLLGGCASVGALAALSDAVAATTICLYSPNRYRDNGVKAFCHSLHPSKENKIILK